MNRESGRNKLSLLMIVLFVMVILIPHLSHAKYKIHYISPNTEFYTPTTSENIEERADSVFEIDSKNLDLLFSKTKGKLKDWEPSQWHRLTLKISNLSKKDEPLFMGEAQVFLYRNSQLTIDSKLKKRVLKEIEKKAAANNKPQKEEPELIPVK